MRSLYGVGHTTSLKTRIYNSLQVSRFLSHSAHTLVLFRSISRHTVFAPFGTPNEPPVENRYPLFMERFTDDRLIFAVGDDVKLKHQMEHSSGSDVQNNKLKLEL
jgi:hypothetical protein